MNYRNARLVLFFLPIFIGSVFFTSAPLLRGNQTTTENLQIAPCAANPAFGSIQLSSDQIFRGQTLKYNVTVGAFGLPLEFLNWSVDIQNATGNLSDYSFATKFNSPQLNGSWYVDPAQISAGAYNVVLWIKNGSDETWIYQNFTVLNNLPVIYSIYAEKSTIDRTVSFNVTINATDVEIADLAPNSGTDPNIFVHVYYRDTNGVTHTKNAQNLGNGNYSALIDDIGITSPTGVYTFWAGVQDYRPSMEPAKEISSNILLITVRNNNPTIDLSSTANPSGLMINDLNPLASDISVRMGNTINVTIIAGDVENTVRYILIDFISGETGEWVNYTMNYLDFPHTLIINTEDLGVGTWYVYITVIDADGGSVTPQIRPTIEILAEPWTIAAPIVFFIIGLVVGLAIGSPLLAWRTRQKAARKALETPITEEEKTLGSEKTRKALASQEAGEEEEEEDTNGAEESESRTQMKRKIRRRIN